MLSVFGLEIEPSSPRQSPAQPTIQKKICPKFMELLATPEPENCDTCDRCSDEDGCLSHDCISKIPCCEDITCKKNLFYRRARVKRHDTVLSRIMRNCELGLILVPDDLILDDIATMYGLSKERIRQIEEHGLYSLSKKIHENPAYLDLADNGKNLRSRLQKYKCKADHRTAYQKTLRERVKGATV